jgi:hypothetical protein
VDQETFRIERTLSGRVFNPPYFIADNGVTGQRFIMALAWSGNFLADFSLRDKSALTFRLAPLAPGPLRVIAPGETVISPEVHLGPCHGTLDAAVAAWHAHIRTSVTPPRFNDFPESIAPQAGEWVLEKTKASAFFQTPLASYMVKNQIDSVVVCGVSTSGCVRASVVDSFSNGFTTFVVDDCCFDRSNFAHCANLFDMNAKYATVVSSDELSGMLLGRQMQGRA